jgi:trehalose 6-phosphate phosphatase
MAPALVQFAEIQGTNRSSSPFLRLRRKPRSLGISRWLGMVDNEITQSPQSSTRPHSGGAGSCAVIHSSLAAPVAADEILTASGRPVALFLDVDGTLLDIADRPDRVAVPAGLVDALAGAERKLDGALALISGRELDELDRLFRPLRLRAAAVHGAELRLDSNGAPIPSPGTRELPVSLWTKLTDALSGFPGTFAENKRYSFTVHYRQAPGGEASVREAVRRLVKDEPEVAVEVMNARRAIELKAPGYDKGRAIETFLSVPPFLGRTPIYIGDDKTDEAGFAAVSAHGGLAYSVGRLRPGARGVFSRPSDVRALLVGFAERRIP